MKISEVFSPEYLLSLSEVRSLEEFSFWKCPGCGELAVVPSIVKKKMCRDFSHKPARMELLENDAAVPTEL